MLFNLYNFDPHYLNASDGIFIEECLRMEDYNDVSKPIFPTLPDTVSTVWNDIARQAFADATADE
ncbi:MAG: hypothetical protein ACI4S1_05320 [Roseburia sp.]